MVKFIIFVTLVGALVLRFSKFLASFLQPPRSRSDGPSKGKEIVDADFEELD